MTVPVSRNSEIISPVTCEETMLPCVSVNPGQTSKRSVLVAPSKTALSAGRTTSSCEVYKDSHRVSSLAKGNPSKKADPGTISWQDVLHASGANLAPKAARLVPWFGVPTVITRETLLGASAAAALAISPPCD